METMQINFARMKQRILGAIELTNLDDIFNTLSGFKEPTIVTGVGGSSVVSTYLAEVLNEKNRIICQHMFPRDLSKMNLDGYKNVIACSYSGGNIGVDYSYRNDLKRFLFSKNAREDAASIQYHIWEKEDSYVSLSATMIPMSIAFLYYTNNNLALLKEILDESFEYLSDMVNIYEVIYGKENNTAAIIFESSMTEAGLGAVVLHEKYNYCHGRINLNKELHNQLFYFDGNTQLDNLYKENLKNSYERMTIIPAKYDDRIINDFYQSFIMLQICRQIATRKLIDLSLIKECPENDAFYLFKGEM